MHPIGLIMAKQNVAEVPVKLFMKSSELLDIIRGYALLSELHQPCQLPYTLRLLRRILSYGIFCFLCLFCLIYS